MQYVGSYMNVDNKQGSLLVMKKAIKENFLTTMNNIFCLQIIKKEVK